MSAPIDTAAARELAFWVDDNPPGYTHVARTIRALADALDVVRRERDEALADSAGMRWNVATLLRAERAEAERDAYQHDAETWRKAAMDAERRLAELDEARAEAEHNRIRAEGAELDLAREREAVVRMREAATRVAWFLREAEPRWINIATDDGQEIATLLGLAVTLEAALDAGAGTGEETDNGR